MDRILAIDDNQQILRLVTVNLQARNFIVQPAGSGEEAIDLFKIGQYDLILLDLILPGISGIEVCKWIRLQSDVPIIVLSAQTDEELKVHALDAGADDYITKPFSQEEMLARVRAVLRRSTSGASDKKGEIQIKGLTINLSGRRAFIDGADIHLTRTEFALLAELAQNQEAVMTHENLLARVWGPEYRDSNHYLHIYLGRVRKKLGNSMEPLLETVPGIGYILHSSE
jgi:two-component system, OmpR family, KDP operon response regulator KdpE